MAKYKVTYKHAHLNKEKTANITAPNEKEAARKAEMNLKHPSFGAVYIKKIEEIGGSKDSTFKVNVTDSAGKAGVIEITASSAVDASIMVSKLPHVKSVRSVDAGEKKYNYNVYVKKMMSSVGGAGMLLDGWSVNVVASGKAEASEKAKAIVAKQHGENPRKLRADASRRNEVKDSRTADAGPMRTLSPAELAELHQLFERKTNFAVGKLQSSTLVEVANKFKTSTSHIAQLYEKMKNSG